MKIYSEKTNKQYATVEECLKAEEAFDKAEAEKKAAKEKALAEKKAKEEKLAAERKARAIEIEAAYKASVESYKHYQELLKSFIHDYGSFHMTVHTGDLNPFDSFKHLFQDFWI